MIKVIDLDSTEARDFFLKGSSYFSADLPDYFSFEPVLKRVSDVLDGRDCFSTKELIRNPPPAERGTVNYPLFTNKDGRFAWRPLEIIHPTLYVSTINILCRPDNWDLVKRRFSEFSRGKIRCCSIPMLGSDSAKDSSAQILTWWQEIEQQSIIYSLKYSHLLLTDVADCYGSLYTHSIAWAIHGMERAKKEKNNKELLGNKLDSYIRQGRSGQTNGIAQGSVLIDFIAELVLGFVDSLISESLELESLGEFKILRYRDDYRIFTNSDFDADKILKIISEKLKTCGMRIADSKTHLSTDIISTSIKADKIAAMNLQDLGTANAPTLQKKLLRLHSFAQKYPNSGALKRLLANVHIELASRSSNTEDRDVQVLSAIFCDIAVTSPGTIPAVAASLSQLMQMQNKNEKQALWTDICRKMSRLPNNGYLEIWLQRVTKPESVDLAYDWTESLCRIANGDHVALWNSEWIECDNLRSAHDASNILVKQPRDMPELISPEEIELFSRRVLSY
ncbi:MAG: RNA-directed DNA polymerase [Acetobacteraceae bacterium]|jgi:RNA-directed DNA polymerase|nr:RNA-directed DNA polymerase [Acetobacteraceae bacterium]